MAKDLVKIIQANPGCVATIDNDDWWLMKAKPANWEDLSEEEQDDWSDDPKNTLAMAGNVKSIGSGYGSGNCYGGDILQALAKIVGIEIESV